jgi:hypothetical protein
MENDNQTDENRQIAPTAVEPVVLDDREQELLERLTGGRWKKYGRVAMAAMGGIPWVGSILSVAATLSSENDQARTNKLLALWVQEHEGKLKELIADLQRIFARLDTFGNTITERLESPEYLGLVKETFRVWDQAETSEKREMLRKLITNAGGSTLSDDDIVRLFIDFIEKFHELHFRVIREIYQRPRITRGEIWENTGTGARPREDSSKADLFKLLIRDLSTGEIVRQARATDAYGNWQRKPTQKRPAGTLKSAFDTADEYVLTALGADFVHYVMEDLAPQLEGGAAGAAPPPASGA